MIERSCGGMRKPEGYTDSKGRFSFQLGQNQGMMADDASVGNSQMDPLGNSSNSPFGTSGRSRGGSGFGGSDPRLMGCELRACWRDTGPRR